MPAYIVHNARVSGLRGLLQQSEGGTVADDVLQSGMALYHFQVQESRVVHAFPSPQQACWKFRTKIALFVLTLRRGHQEYIFSKIMKTLKPTSFSLKTLATASPSTAAFLGMPLRANQSPGVAPVVFLTAMTCPNFPIPKNAYAVEYSAITTMRPTRNRQGSGRGMVGNRGHGAAEKGIQFVSRERAGEKVLA